MMHEYLHGVVLQSVEVVFQFSIKLSVKYLPFGKKKVGRQRMPDTSQRSFVVFF